MSGPTKSDSRSRIIAAAVDTLGEYGYRGATISRITQRSGLPASSVYWHFEDKDDLVVAAVESLYAAWVDSQPLLQPPTLENPAAGPDGDASARVATALRRKAQQVVDCGQADRGFLRIGLMLTLELDLVDARARARYVALREEVVQQLADSLQDLVTDAGLDVPADLCSHLAQLLIVNLDGLFFTLRAGVEVDLDLVVELITAILVQAVRDGAG